MKFITGVSKWTLEFEDGTEIYIDAVSEERTTIFLGGRYVVSLENITLLEELLDKLKRGEPLKRLISNMPIVEANKNGSETETTEITFEYPSPKLINANIHAISGEVATTTLTFHKK